MNNQVFFLKLNALWIMLWDFQVPTAPNFNGKSRYN